MMTKCTNLYRNQIVWVDFGNDNIGCEQNGIRPAIVVQNNIGNKHSTTTIVIPITSQAKANLPTHVLLSKDCGLAKESTALCEQIKVISKERIIKVGSAISSADIEKIDNAVLISMGVVSKVH